MADNDTVEIDGQELQPMSSDLTNLGKEMDEGEIRRFKKAIKTTDLSMGGTGLVVINADGDRETLALSSTLEDLEELVGTDRPFAVEYLGKKESEAGREYHDFEQYR